MAKKKKAAIERRLRAHIAAEHAAWVSVTADLSLEQLEQYHNADHKYCCVEFIDFYTGALTHAKHCNSDHKHIETKPGEAEETPPPESQESLL